VAIQCDEQSQIVESVVLNIMSIFLYSLSFALDLLTSLRYLRTILTALILRGQLLSQERLDLIKLFKNSRVSHATIKVSA